MDSLRAGSPPEQILECLQRGGWDRPALVEALSKSHTSLMGLNASTRQCWISALQQLLTENTQATDDHLHCRLALLAAELNLWSIASEYFSRQLSCTATLSVQPDLYFNLAFASLQAADHHAAERYLQLAIAQEPDNREISYLRAWILKCKKLIAAQFLRLPPDSEWVRRSKGTALTATPLGAHHAASLYRLQRDEQLTDIVGIECLSSIDAASAWIKVTAETELALAILHPDFGLIGVASFSTSGVQLDAVTDSVARFYYWIDPDYQNKGYGTQSLALLRQAARHRNVLHLFSTINTKNLASLAVLEKLGGGAVRCTTRAMRPSHRFYHYGDAASDSQQYDMLSTLLEKTGAIEHVVPYYQDLAEG